MLTGLKGNAGDHSGKNLKAHGGIAQGAKNEGGGNQHQAQNGEGLQGLAPESQPVLRRFLLHFLRDDATQADVPCGRRESTPLEARLEPERGAKLLRNYLTVMTLELQTLARACGKSHVLNLEPEDLAALTLEAAAMAKVPLAGTDWIPGS